MKSYLKVKSIKLFLLVIFSLFIFTKCLRPLCLTATNTSASALTVDIRGGKSCNKIAEISHVFFYRDGENSPIWVISAPGGATLSSVQYGVVPTHFSETTQASALTPGETIIINVNGVGSEGTLKVTLLP